MTNYEWLITSGELKIFIQKLYWYFAGTVIDKYKIPLEKNIDKYSENEKLTIIADWLQKDHREPLKPCPFCGNDKPRIVKRSGVMLYEIYCNECDSSSGECLTEDEAIYKWNRRAEK